MDNCTFALVRAIAIFSLDSDRCNTSRRKNTFALVGGTLRCAREELNLHFGFWAIQLFAVVKPALTRYYGFRNRSADVVRSGLKWALVGLYVVHMLCKIRA